MADSKNKPGVELEPTPSRRPVYVVGAGLSAGLGFPLVNDLLVRLWNRLPKGTRADLLEVIKFHHPSFDPKRATSFPNVETLLSGMMVNEQLFDASRAAPGRFTAANLQRIRQALLLAIADWFHELHEAQASTSPKWIAKFARHVADRNAVVISFNWDLVLDSLLFGEGINSQSYGLGSDGPGPVLLKPHGSLNWFSGTLGKKIKEDRRALLHTEGDKQVYRFHLFRAPRGKQTYMPLIIPPIFNKSFDDPIFRDIWRRCVSELSRATEVTFLGYSLPEADLHARFILRCGFQNQVEGELSADGTRAKATGPCPVTIVNPDLSAARRIEGAVGNHPTCDWKPMLAADWANSL
jgi:hypothetical protein